ncbi:TIGR03013 family XrtA/PEP-CTERM system glycosyltransferase [Allosphingosinicella indica]|uniref:Sugar transferase, PEP-CTERM system associated/exopolysaccharide biosynthesis polyprenyl glycosylphosphotransferase n=1 Tax=Allosphingosinicella indica TaxID=941907 RepID=A0A1X7GFM5_9SPHN|nr:TIGR03013 family XrtA/PEP-CTERM system glycosyltransferase [Allosphingosinicella indica]SMF68965.1 sugar transferase, PEP-CTERM system associated/exopolysaccharide biosynthesis polyprenyl glycosylphosphotransferase [Allosphingosinicella indica]
MIRLFRHHIPYTALLLGIVDFLMLLFAAEGGWLLRNWQIGTDIAADRGRLPEILSFAIVLQLAMTAVGVYAVDAVHSLRIALPRIAVAVALGVLLLALVFFLVPAISFWRSNLLYAMIFAMLLLVAARLMFGRLLGSASFKRRVLVLGAGPRAAGVEALAAKQGANFAVAGYVAMNDGPVATGAAVNRAGIDNLAAYTIAHGVSEVVLALEERRNALPLADLLRIRTTGVQVTDLSTFLERETGRVDLDTLNPSWLIFSDGFTAGRRLSSFGKRGFDILVSALILALAWPLIALTALLIKLESRGPAFYRQRRVGLFGEAFDVLKLRSMRQDAEVSGVAVWAQQDDPRITRIGSIIRKLRIDELPQAWSVLKGEMSFVGPRPERPQFVSDLEARLPYYAERHMVKPGITGWAQINYPYGASVEDARRKLEFDLYYAKNYTPFLDLLILLLTVRVILWPSGAR